MNLFRRIATRALAGAIAQAKPQIVGAIGTHTIEAAAMLSSEICGSIQDADFGVVANLEKPKVIAGIRQAFQNFCARTETRTPLLVDAIVKALRS